MIPVVLQAELVSGGVVLHDPGSFCKLGGVRRSGGRSGARTEAELDPGELAKRAERRDRERSGESRRVDEHPRSERNDPGSSKRPRSH